MKSKIPHPDPREEEICTETEKGGKPFLGFRRGIMGFKEG